MAYADEDFYFNTYYGDSLRPDDVEKWLERASDELDTLTRGRLINAQPVNSSHITKIKKAACAIAEALHSIDVQQKAAAATKQDDGSYRGPVTSISSGRESISFSAGNASASVYAAAAISEAERQKLISSIAVKYLANIPDANGVNLLYAGEDRYVPQYDNSV